MQWSGASGLSGETASPGCRLAALCVECAARMPRTWESAVEVGRRHVSTP